MADSAFDTELLLRRKPYLRALLDQPGGSAYRFEQARSGERYVVDQRPLSSRYKPGEEAGRLLQAMRSDRIVLVSGAGNPLLIERILLKRSATQITILIDHRSDLLQFLLAEDPAMQQFAMTPNCHVFAPHMLASLWSYLSGLPVDGFRGITMIRHPGSLAGNQDFYREAESTVQGFLKSGLSDLLTRFEFESLWFRNTLLNLRYLPEVPDSDSPLLLRHWKSCWKNRPALLIGAGPSLRQSLPLIKALSAHCLLVACDTALKPLLRYGIRPQIVHILDAQPHSLLHMRGEDLDGILLFVDLVAHPHLREKLSAPFVYSTTARYLFNAAGESIQLQTPGASLAERQCGEIGSLQSGGSVATSAFDLLRFFEASPIILIGTDMAWTGRQLHSVGTHHYEKWAGLQTRLNSLEHINESLIQRRKSHPVPSLDGGSVPGDHVLDLYRRWFEDSIANLEGLPVWNLTAAGANINGAIRPETLDVAHVLERLSESVRQPAGTFRGMDLPAAREHRSAILDDFADDLSRQDLADSNALERFFDRHPEAAALRKKADAYIRRNSDRLTEERKRLVLKQYAGKEIRRLLRWIMGRTL